MARQSALQPCSPALDNGRLTSCRSHWALPQRRQSPCFPPQCAVCTSAPFALAWQYRKERVKRKRPRERGGETPGRGGRCLCVCVCVCVCVMEGWGQASADACCDSTKQAFLPLTCNRVVVLCVGSWKAAVPEALCRAVQVHAPGSEVCPCYFVRPTPTFSGTSAFATQSTWATRRASPHLLPPLALHRSRQLGQIRLGCRALVPGHNYEMRSAAPPSLFRRTRANYRTRRCKTTEPLFLRRRLGSRPIDPPFSQSSRRRTTSFLTTLLRVCRSSLRYAPIHHTALC